MKLNLARLETRLQALIEGSAARLFSGKGAPGGLAHQLVEAMLSGIQLGPDESPVAPDLFILMVHPSQVQALQADHALIGELTQSLSDAGVEAGLSFLSPPVVRVVGAYEIAPGEVQVKTDHQENLPQTAAIEVEGLEKTEVSPPSAFLIVDGTRIFPITKAVVNLGRREDNHLVINDRRVSRLHAQVRVIRGHYVIFDLDSSGGTWVNGERIHQRTLNSGDVISLSGVPLVFGQDPEEQGDTLDHLILS